MSNRLNQIGSLLLVGFLSIALTLTYWMVWGRDDLLARNDNPRRVEAERAIKRGALLDYQGTPLVWSVQDGVSPSQLPIYRRASLAPAEAFSVLGYYSLTYGTGGLESAYNRELRGDNITNQETRLLNEMVHHPQKGSTLRLTLSKAVQTQTYQAFKGRRGSAVVIEIPSGAVLALVSTPGFDPARLDRDFDRLDGDQNAPLLNRPLQGVYQPGGMLQTVLLAALFNAQPSGETSLVDGDQPLKVNGLTLTCATQPDHAPETVLEAYIYGCPTAIVGNSETPPEVSHLWAMIGAFRLTQAPPMDRLTTESGPSIPAWTTLSDPALLRAELTGQGRLTLTPLQMALAAAVIANEGNTVNPYLVSAIYPPDVDPGAFDGSKDDPYHTPIVPAGEAVITREAAERIEAAMREAVERGSAMGAQPSNTPGISVHGAAGIAYTGTTAHAWFIGFAALPDGRKWVASVVIEDSINPGAAAALVAEIFSTADTP